MKLRKTIKNWRLTEMYKRIYLPLEPIHLQVDLQKLKHKSPLRFFAHALYCSPDAWLFKWYLRPAASVLFFLVFNIAYAIFNFYKMHMWCIAYAILPYEPYPCVWARVIPNVPSIMHMRSWVALRKCVSNFLSGTKKWNQLHVSALE